MNRRSFLRTSAAVGACAARHLLAAAPKPKPNIVLILSDDQAWTDYGFMGHPDIQTPNLDKLATSGVLFRRRYVPTAICRPSLMTLITGHYAYTTGITGYSFRMLRRARGYSPKNIPRRPIRPSVAASRVIFHLSLMRDVCLGPTQQSDLAT